LEASIFTYKFGTFSRYDSRPVARFKGLGGQNTFLGVQDFLFLS